MKSYKGTCDMFEIMEVAEKFYEGGTTSKIQLGKIPTMPVMPGDEREEKLPCLPTPRRTALESAR